MKEKLIKFIDLKTIITLILAIAMVFFTYIKIIPADLFITVTGSVFTYYFTRKNDKEV